MVAVIIIAVENEVFTSEDFGCLVSCSRIFIVISKISRILLERSDYCRKFSI